MIDYFKIRRGESLFDFLKKQPWWFQFGVVIGLIFAVLTYGVYGPGFSATDFIYAQF